MITTPTDPERSGELPTSGENDAEVLKWVHAAIVEGEKLVKADPSYPKMDTLMRYVMGEQYTGDRVPKYVPRVVINRLKKAIKSHVSAMTDLRPLFAYKTANTNYQIHADLLNQLVVLWWVNTFADLEIATGLQYALTVGSSYIVVEFDPKFGPYGDNRLIPKDPRDVLPIRPSRDRSVQNWQGVVIREAHSINALTAAYPDKANLLRIHKNSTSKFGGILTRFRNFAASTFTPMTTVELLRQKGSAQTPGTYDEVPVFRTYFHDHSINTTSETLYMGKADTNWGYAVKPGARLYPRGRLVVSTEHVVLYDGPNPYWHGLFPVVKLALDPWPWLLLGIGLGHDLVPAQEGLNKLVNDIFGVLDYAAHRGTAFDKNAVPDSVVKAFDSRETGFKLRYNPVIGEPFKMIDPAQLPPWTMEFLTLFSQEFDNLSGTANLQALLQLRQSPSGETIQKYIEALTPEIRLESRYLEASLREIAEIVKCNIFQYYSTERRILALGDAGLQLEDLDYDPNNLIPAMAVGDQGYLPSLDAGLSRDARAKYFMNLFTFYVAPNSLLNLHATERKMMYVQLSRMGYMDFWTLMEMLEIPNVGSPPPVPIPTGEMQPGVDPATRQPTQVPVTEMKQPMTITERLIAQQLMGIGMTENPAGRKATGQAPPNLETKTDESGAPRTTMTES